MNFSELGALHTSQCQLVFSASIGSFQGLPAETSEVILLSQRLALTYSTIPQPLLQAFFTFFSPFFALCIHQPVFCSVSGAVLIFIPPFPRKTAAAQKVQRLCGVSPHSQRSAMIHHIPGRLIRPSRCSNTISMVFSFQTVRFSRTAPSVKTEAA